MQSFETRPYQKQLLDLQHLLEEVLPRYDLHGAQSALLQYEDNAVYHITTRVGEDFVLRISSAEGQSEVAQHSEMQWLLALRRETDLRVPEPISNVDGALVTTVAIMDVPEPRQCVLMCWVPGEPPMPGIQPETVERIGAFTAHLHHHAEHFTLPIGFMRPCWDWEQVFGTSSVLSCEEAIDSLTPRQREVLTAVSMQVRQALSTLGKEVSMWGLIHADLHRDNILLHHGEVGVIDFDDCGWGYYLFDLASALDSFSRRVVNHPKDYLLLRDAYLAGYDRIRALPAGFDGHLRIFKAMRDMVNINFILRSKNANVQTWGHQRVGQIIAQLEVYLDGSPSSG